MLIVRHAELLPGTGGQLHVIRRGIVGAAMKASRLTARMLTGGEESRVRRVPLGSSIEETVRKLSVLAAPCRVRLEATILDSEIDVLGDPDDVESILFNLVVNAIDATPEEGGLVRIELRSEGEHAFLEVVDHGPGMSPEALEKAFRSSFTTKELGGGRGLLLVDEAVKRLRGEVAVGESDGGTRVVVRLPRADPSALDRPD